MYTTTYQSAFGQQHAVPSRPIPAQEDTSNDSAIALALALGGTTSFAAALAPGAKAPAGTSPLSNPHHISHQPPQQQEPHGTVPWHEHHSAPHTHPKLIERLAQHKHTYSADALPADTTSLMFPTGPVYPDLVEQPPHIEERLSRQLSRAPSIKLIPRVWSGLLPGPDVVSEDRQRLLLRLEMYHLGEKQVMGDGSCQFRSLSDQLYGSQDHHATVRAAVVQELREHASKYEEYVPSEYKAYCEEMARPGSWGDHVTLQAAANHYGMRVMVVTSYKENAVIAIDAEKPKSQRILYLSFWAEVHYNSLYPGDEGPPLPSSATASPGGSRVSSPARLPPKLLGSRKLGRLVRTFTPH